jgi:S1-C subfamily serine protease
MSQENILKISKLYKNAVAKLTCLNNEIDACEPFTLTNESNEEVCGSGFFVRCSSLYLPRELSHRRYLITNAHVIEGSSTRRVSISFPHLGDTTLWGTVILACKTLDFAIVEVTAENNDHLEKELGKSFIEVFRTIPFVKMCSKPFNTRSELAKNVLAIGFPLASNDSHISTGNVSGKHEHYLQVNGSINSGNSGGPLFDENGQAIGICAASFEESEGITLAVEWFHVTKMLKHYWDKSSLVVYPPSLGLSTKRLIDAYAITKLKDENTKGCLVSKVFPQSSLKKSIKDGDIIMSIGDDKNEFELDRSGNVNVPYQHDKVKFYSLNVLLLLDPESCFVRVYSKNRRKTVNFQLMTIPNVIRYVMPSLEKIDCFTFGGLVFTQLTKNHMEEVPDDVDPNVISFFTSTQGCQSAVVISSYFIPCSLIEQGYSVKKLSIVKRFNNKKVSTVQGLRELVVDALKDYEENPEVKKCKFVGLETSSTKYIMDMEKVQRTELLLRMTPSYPIEYSVVPCSNKKRKFELM